MSVYYWEKQLQLTIFPDLKRGRVGWDLEHTKAVVHWVKKICDIESVIDNKVLIAAAYGHDWGYADLFETAPTMAEIQAMKQKHMEIGAENMREMLENNLKNEFEQDQIDRIVHLVAVHDKLDDIQDDDEIALVEADTLGALDTDFVTPTLSEKDNEFFLKEVRRKRWPKFSHSVAKKAFVDLLEKRKNYYQ